MLYLRLFHYSSLKFHFPLRIPPSFSFFLPLSLPFSFLVKVPRHPFSAVPWHQDSGYFEPRCDNDLILTVSFSFFFKHNQVFFSVFFSSSWRVAKSLQNFNFRLAQAAKMISWCQPARIKSCDYISHAWKLTWIEINSRSLRKAITVLRICVFCNVLETFNNVLAIWLYLTNVAKYLNLQNWFRLRRLRELVSLCAAWIDVILHGAARINFAVRRIENWFASW